MKPIDEQQRSRYFAELSIALRRLGLDTQPPENGLLPVTKGGAPVCLVSGGGGTRYRPENMTTEAMKEAMEKASETAAIVKEYMSLMESAPFLKADGLDESYRMLADFNGVVLAGHDAHNGYGVQFVTWEWSYDRTGVTTGHYAAHHYEDAKQDFAIRAGLVDRRRLFSDEQLAELCGCIDRTLENDFALSYEQEKGLRELQEQMKDLIPAITSSGNQEQSPGLRMEPTM